MDLLGNLTEKDCEQERLLFEKDEVVQFLCLEPRVDEAKGHIFIKSQVLSGIHAGKEHSLMISGSDHEVSRRMKAQFFFRSGFWSPAELAEKDAEGKSTIIHKLKNMVGHKFQGKASKVNTKDGKSFQNIEDIKDLGMAEAGTTTANVGY